MMNLSDKQLEIIDKFSKLKIGAIFTKVGTGKTLSSLILASQSDCDFVLFLTENYNKRNIKAEFYKWEFNKEYEIHGYKTLSSSKTLYPKLIELLKTKKRPFLICDESTAIKTPSALVTKRTRHIREYCEYVLLLNGTPLTKNEYDIYEQFNLLSPKIFNMSKENFQQSFFDKIIFKRRGEAERSFYKFSDVNKEYFNKIIAPYVIYGELEFNKSTFNFTNKIEITEETRELYAARFKQLKERLKNGAAGDDVINALNYFNHICSNDEHLNKEIAKYAKDKQVLIFSSYRSQLELIKENLNDECYILDAKQSEDEREKIKEEFKHNSKPLLLTYGLGSKGLNMQFCNEIVFGSLTYDYALIEQAKGRIRRMGQENDVKYTFILPRTPVTSLIERNIERKHSLKEILDELINETKNQDKPTGYDQANKLAS